jgi:hypothetical protein
MKRMRSCCHQVWHGILPAKPSVYRLYVGIDGNAVQEALREDVNDYVKATIQTGR